MTSISWWRSWHGAPTDPKWSVIAVKSKVRVGIVQGVVWTLLDYASQNTPRGSIEGFDVETYSVFSGNSEDEINAVILAMENKGIIKDKAFVNWEKRQPKREDDSNERVRKYREMKRNVTHGNADNSAETPQITDTDNRSDTDTDTETNTDKGSSTTTINDKEPGPENLSLLLSQSLFSIYEKEIGPITPRVSDLIQDAEKEYSPEWIVEAINISTLHNKRNWAYVSGILKNWKTNGKGTNKKTVLSANDERQAGLERARQRYGVSK